MKSQISTQIFVYLVAIIIAGLILVIGGRTIVSVLNTINEVNIDEFKNSFNNRVVLSSRQIGSINKQSFSLPEPVTKVCFVDSMVDGKFTITAPINNLLIKNSVENNVEKNVFVFADQEITQDFYVDKLDVDVDYLCITNTRNFELWFKGQGKSALMYQT